jgi:hypothetical protein
MRADSIPRKFPFPYYLVKGSRQDYFINGSRRLITCFNSDGKTIDIQAILKHHAKTFTQNEVWEITLESCRWKRYSQYQNSLEISYNRHYKIGGFIHTPERDIFEIIFPFLSTTALPELLY